MAEHDAIVIGAGISGLLTSLMLSKKGKNVLVLEKSPFVGGVCRSYDVEGYRVDTGPHIITRLEYGPLKEIMDKYFVQRPRFIPHGRYYVRMNGRIKPFPWNLTAWMGFDLLPVKDRMNLARQLISAGHLYASDPGIREKSVASLLGDGLTAKSRNFLDALCGFMTGGSGMQETPVARFVDAEKYKTQSNGMFDKIMNVLFKEGAVDQTYPQGGIQTLTDSVMASIPEKKVEIRLGEKVEKISPESREVGTDKDNYKAETIIYSGYSNELPDIIEGLPKEYVEKLSRIKQSKTLTLWLGLKKKIYEKQGSEIWIGPPHSWVVPTSNYDPQLAPKGRHLAGLGFLVPWESNLEKQEKKILDYVYQAMPEIEKNVEMTHFQQLVPEKAAWTITSEFASIRTPLDNLYLVGTDTTRKSMGVTRASYSVLELEQELAGDKRV